MEELMTTFYYCRHCGRRIGSIMNEVAHNVVVGQLTEEEKKEMLQFDKYGNVYVKTICEDCQETLESNPHYHEYDTFIQ